MMDLWLEKLSFLNKWKLLQGNKIREGILAVRASLFDRKVIGEGGEDKKLGILNIND